MVCERKRDYSRKYTSQKSQFRGVQIQQQLPHYNRNLAWYHEPGLSFELWTAAEAALLSVNSSQIIEYFQSPPIFNPPGRRVSSEEKVKGLLAIGRGSQRVLIL
jgi:hypothetical protein